MLVLTDTRGRIKQWSNNTKAEVEGFLPPDILAVERDTQPDPNDDYYNVEAEEWAVRPPQPTALHTWDWSTYTWTDPDAATLAAELQAFKDNAKLTLNNERLARGLAPITVSGITLDADETSRANIEGTLQIISISAALPAGWVGWKDFHNNFCLSDATAEQVQTFLGAVVVALGNRTQSLYATMWAAKVAVDAATSKEGVTQALETAWSAVSG